MIKCHVVKHAVVDVVPFPHADYPVKRIPGTRVDFVLCYIVKRTHSPLVVPNHIRKALAVAETQQTMSIATSAKRNCGTRTKVGTGTVAHCQINELEHGNIRPRLLEPKPNLPHEEESACARRVLPTRRGYTAPGAQRSWI